MESGYKHFLFRAAFIPDELTYTFAKVYIVKASDLLSLPTLFFSSFLDFLLNKKSGF